MCIYVNNGMLIIGNGESRKNIDLTKINATMFGCNGIYRDYNVRHLICVDRKMVREAVEAKYNQTSFIYTRKCWFNEFAQLKNLRILPDLPYVGSERYDDPIHWGSGPYAILTAIKTLTQIDNYNSTINIIGFDLYGNNEGKINNVYKDTDNYDLAIKSAVDPRYWIEQIGILIKLHPTLDFKFYNVQNWRVPKQWKYRNFHLDSIDNFNYNITTEGKDI